ncbi:MAG: single-stranded-DNA-specific exonuclease RecJ [Clostridia bacterium]|nr:single-stranded-DNA-specific exonuclease RecJ [Clostridia bacterium]
MAFKKWNVAAAQKEAAKELAQLCDADGLVALIAINRGVDTPEKLDEFLAEDPFLPSPFSMAGMYEAAIRIRSALENGEHITIFGDYDCDGVTATAIVYNYLVSKGAEADYYIPEREGEGYGMSAAAVEAIKGRGTSLIITVDNGIRAINEIDLAAQLGIDTVVTDHHLPGDDLPRAAALVDPHLPYCQAGLQELSGAGVALMLVAAVEGVEAEEMLCSFAPLAALGTVADVVPLLGANRVIVREGLAAINAGENKVINALYTAAAGKLPVTSESLAFVVAPRINAAGRMGSAEKALKLLIQEDSENIAESAEFLCSRNTERRTAEQEILAEAIESTEANGYCYDRVVIVEGKGWHCGVVGIVASCIAERYGRPAIVLSGENGVYTGSGRSIEGFNLYDALCSCSHLFEKFGGHSGAAGLTIKGENLEEFRRCVNDYAKAQDMPVPTLNIDCRLNPAAVNVAMVQRLSQLEPYGAGNPVPLFGFYGATVLRVDSVGEGRHTRLTVGKNDAALSCMFFSTSKEELGYSVGETVDIAANISISYYKGAPSVSVIGRGIRPAGSDGEVLAKGLRCYEDYRRGSLSGQQLADIIPVREEIGEIWRIIKANPNISLEKLMTIATVSPAKAALSLDVLQELGLAESKSGRYLVNPNAKADLSNSQILKSAQVMI